MSVWLTRFEMRLMHIYRAWSAIHPPCCRYIPTCSAYAIEALCTHPFLTANNLILRRILRCHPWGAWGFDPVPPASSSATGFSIHRCALSQGNHFQ